MKNIKCFACSRNIKFLDMNKKEKLALFLGMLSGDGCLSISHNGEGYRNYPINFCNTNKEIVKLFDDLFF